MEKLTIQKTEGLDVESTYFKRLEDEAISDSAWIAGFVRFHHLSFYEKFKMNEILENGPKIQTTKAFTCLECEKYKFCLKDKISHC